ncbi:MAG: laminin G domain-containing protein [Sedimentisphaerales bacterium]|nr:laminin G domain-containing protein [Sedimentisphaerales bacterium]
MKKLILLTVVLGMLAGVSMVQAELLFRWKLDDAVGSPSVADATGHGYSGTCTGTPAFGQADAKEGTSVYIEPSDGADYFTLPYMPELATPSFSISFWMKLEDNYGAHQVPFSNGSFSPTSQKDGSTAIQWGGYDDLTLRLGYNTSVWTEYRAVGTAQLNTWHHIVITVDYIADVADYTYYDYRVVRRYYLDGVLVDEDLDDAFMPNRHERPFSIGVRQMGASTDPAYPCKGYFDDVQYYTHALNPGTVANMYANPGTTGEIELIPDDFEAYADTAELGSYWSTAGGAVSLETTEVQAGAQALKALMTSSGTVTKTLSYTSHYSEKTPYELALWYKGLVANPAGSLTVTVRDPLNAVVAQSVVAGATQVADWTELRIPVVDDPNVWKDVKSLEFQIGAAATMYFDSISFERPVEPAPYRILQWKFDESSGMSAADSTIYSNDGALGSWFTGSEWVIDGGRSGDPGDNALSFVGAGNNADAEVISGAMSPDLSGDTSWSITMWVYLNSDSPGNDIILGGLGDVWSAPTTGDISQRYITIDGDTLQPRLLRGYESAWSFSSGWGQTLTTGQWYMLTVTNNEWGNAMDFYINVDRVSGMVWNAVVNASVAAMCPDVNGMATFTAPDGMVDDFSIWAGRLTQGDIAALAGGWTCLNPPVYDFNEDCITDLLDFAEFAAHWLECGRFPSSYCGN